MQQSIQIRILSVLRKRELQRGELAVAIGQRAISGKLKLRLKQMLEDRIIEWTIPNKPNSRLQKYRLTAKGRRLAASLAKKKGRS